MVLATTSLVVAGCMAAANVSVTGTAELGVVGVKSKYATLHHDFQVSFGHFFATGPGLSIGASAALRHAGKFSPVGPKGPSTSVAHSTS